MDANELARNTEMMISSRKYLSVFLPMSLSFISAQLILQTDLIFVSSMGVLSLAAFGVPQKVMIVDIIFAFAIAPVAAVMVASAKNDPEKKLVISRLIHFSFSLGVILTVVGMLCYPIIIDYVIKNPDVASLSATAVFWLTITIPFRLTYFIGTMSLNASMQGKLLMPVLITAVIANGLLNWMFVYYLGFGFVGVYIATFIINILEVLACLYLLREYLYFRVADFFPKRRWLYDLFSKIGPEWARLVSWQFTSFTLLVLFSLDPSWVGRQSVYAVAMEFQALVMMPLIACMRTTAIVLSDAQFKVGFCSYKALKNIALTGVTITFFICVIFIVFGADIGLYFYSISHNDIQWWTAFITITAVYLPLNYLKTLQLGIWQSKNRFHTLFYSESLCYWLILIPIAYFGLINNNPWITWISLPIAEIVMSVYLYSKRNSLVIAQQHSASLATNGKIP